MGGNTGLAEPAGMSQPGADHSNFAERTFFLERHCGPSVVLRESRVVGCKFGLEEDWKARFGFDAGEVPANLGEWRLVRNEGMQQQDHHLHCRSSRAKHQRDPDKTKTAIELDNKSSHNIRSSCSPSLSVLFRFEPHACRGSLNP